MAAKMTTVFVDVTVLQQRLQGLHPPPPSPDLFVPLSITHLTAEWSQSKFRFYLSCVRTLNRKFPNILYFLLVKAALRKQPNLFSTQFSTKQTLCRAPYFFIFTLFFFLEGVHLKALNLTGDWGLPTFCRLNVNVKANNLRMHRGNDPVQVWLAWQTRFFCPTMV